MSTVPSKHRIPRGEWEMTDVFGQFHDFPLTQLVDLLVQQVYLELRLHVDPVVVLRGLAIDALLSVLAGSS
jgi:hypothetical protein